MLKFLATLPLIHDGDCHFLGISPDLTVYVEELYGDDDWLAQSVLTLDGRILQTIDEDSGAGAQVTPLNLPDNLTRPAPVRHTRALNFSGPRLRGMRDAERITDVVRPLTVPTRMKLVEQLRLDVAPPLILGIAASHVLAEALLTPPDMYLVCRRLQIAYALTEPRRDAEGQAYDYDTSIFYAAHRVNVAEADVELSPQAVFAGLPGVDLLRAMDCMVYGGYLFVAEGGTDDRSSRVHVWEISE